MTRETGSVAAAVDLGASGGRVIAGRAVPSGVELHEVTRFGNEPVSVGGTLYWDILRLHAEVVSGLSAAASRLLQECLRCWGSAAGSLEPLLVAVAAAEPLRFVIDADDPVFLPPGDMPSRIVSWLSSRELPAPSEPAEAVRCILDSLALAYRRALLAAQSLSGQHADAVHIVGGGSRNELLCQLTADACRLPVVAGPAEATALGNVLVQARARRGAQDAGRDACDRARVGDAADVHAFR